MNTRPMAFAGAILVILGVMLVSCAHQSKIDENNELRRQIESTRTEFYRSPAEVCESAILHVIDRDAKTGRFIHMANNPHTGQPIIAKWTAYRDATNHTIYGIEYDLTDNQP